MPRLHSREGSPNPDTKSSLNLEPRSPTLQPLPHLEQKSLNYSHSERSIRTHYFPPHGTVVQPVKNPPAMRETCVRSLGWEDSLEEGMATPSSILAWRIPMERGAYSP